ncbi:MAG: DUF1122 domain-containing protein [Candidatus Korarchaeota archaeon]|nr:DUF1122 domain-containing protein [Candidatus Korarchaeota archaeon]NIU82408.1 DUF1122 domain-containing protein [Candidatus Thorarchaeota archaeon]NIW12881.1 DUF1122 domain-containing protein [Candidatus Thorarchaeota archaeon]NIW51075.1 DUF1122 domain-containing protein [Candidatus Korarchaeota archaeon]
MNSLQSLQELDGKPLGHVTLRLFRIGEGRFQQEKHFTLKLAMDEKLSKSPVVEGRYFSGTGYYSPWLEVKYHPVVSFNQTVIDLRPQKLDHQLFSYLSQLLPPGSHMMVTYSNHPETHRQLQRGVPPAATYLGFLLWSVGCTWFKDWYFPEGGWEGNVKLQGNKPPTLQAKQKHFRETKKELEEFLTTHENKMNLKNALERARIVLETIDSSI